MKQLETHESEETVEMEPSGFVQNPGRGGRGGRQGCV